MTTLLVFARRCAFRSAVLPVLLGTTMLSPSLCAQIAPSAAQAATTVKEAHPGKKPLPVAAVDVAAKSSTVPTSTMPTIKSMPLTGLGTDNGGSNFEEVALKLLAIVTEQQGEIQKLQKQIDELQRQVATLQPKAPDTK